MEEFSPVFGNWFLNIVALFIRSIMALFLCLKVTLSYSHVVSLCLIYGITDLQIQ